MSGDASHGDTSLRCARCGTSHQLSDDFCRRCGAALRAGRLPVIRDQRSRAPVPWRETVPVVVRGAAVVAAGTLAEAVLRRLIVRALRRGVRPSNKPGRQLWPLARRRQDKAAVLERPEPDGDGDQVVSETFLFRRVRLRHSRWPGE
jgi:hypothetical protein